MSGTLPINYFDKVSIKNNTPTATTISMSGRRQSKQLAAQYWTLDCNYRRLRRSESAQVMAFLNKQNNSLNSFNVVIPQYSRSNGTIKTIYNSGTSAVSVSTAAAGGTSNVAVRFDTLRPSDFTSAGTTATGCFLAGDFVKFTNHNKVYQLTDDATCDANGYATLAIFPALYEALTTSHDLWYWDVPFTVFNTEQSQEYSLDSGDSTVIQLKLMEAL